ncbi:MAG: hypothetical protein JWO22_2114 [Frankiales bacterium]|nr:hypothetical protein [Frankiales bacterium]
MNEGGGRAPRIDLKRLTSLRAFAALAVFGFHTRDKLHWSVGRHVFGLGYSGVAFFFVLSGFVLTWSTQPGTGARQFYLRRFARIWPMHVVAGAGAAVAFGLGSAWAVTSNLLLLQAWDPRDHVHYSLNTPSWSLSVEAFFYAVWPLAVVLARRRWGLFAALAVGVFGVEAGVAAWLANDGYAHAAAAYVNPLLRLGEFLLGMAMAVAAQRGRGPRVPVPVALVAVLVSLLAARSLLGFPVTDYALVPSYALLIWSAAKADLAGGRSLLAHPWLVYAGKVSFCFYLLHYLVLTAVGKAHVGLPPALLALVALVVTAVIAAGCMHAIEQPMQRRITHRRATTSAL